MPKVRVFVTNGGYGGLHFALGHGVPIVVAGDTEDKMETTRRVEWSGAGINLRTGTPTQAQIATAVERVLSERHFRERAVALQTGDRVAPRVSPGSSESSPTWSRRIVTARRSPARCGLWMSRQGQHFPGCLGEPVGDERVDRPIPLRRIRPVRDDLVDRNRLGRGIPQRLEDRAARLPVTSFVPRLTAAFVAGIGVARGRRHAHSSATGQAEHFGARAVQIVAPSSIVAAFMIRATTGSAGSTASMAERSRRDGAPGCERPSIARASTRRVFVSTTGCRSP